MESCAACIAGSSTTVRCRGREKRRIERIDTNLKLGDQKNESDESNEREGKEGMGEKGAEKEARRFK